MFEIGDIDKYDPFCFCDFRDKLKEYSSLFCDLSQFNLTQDSSDKLVNSTDFLDTVRKQFLSTVE